MLNSCYCFLLSVLFGGEIGWYLQAFRSNFSFLFCCVAMVGAALAATACPQIRSLCSAVCQLSKSRAVAEQVVDSAPSLVPRGCRKLTSEATQ